MMAQIPDGINYQTVIRDSNGDILPNIELSLQMTIRSGTPDGEMVYQESHDVMSNAFGLVSLVIGQGVPQNGEFTGIEWGKSAFYLETAIDLTNGGQFQVLGVTQFLSVPYSLFSGQSGGLLSMTDQERDAIENPLVGMQIFNITTQCLNYWSGSNWFETCGQCTPMPSQADAGQDVTIITEDLSLNLAAITPEAGVGQWTIISGEGGTFTNPDSPTTLFTGQSCTSYDLVWKISTPCNYTTDTISVAFFATPTPANAGENQTIPQATWTTLAANTPLIGQGNWTIIQGTGGQLVTPNSPNSIFLGQTNSLYILEWKISSACTSSNDSAQIVFGCAPQPTIANAGYDQLNYNVSSTNLQGNTPDNGIGQWSLLSGTGGFISDPGNPTSTFSGQTGVAYELKWTISNECGSTNDIVSISFLSWICGSNFTDVRNCQSYITVQIGDQCWMAENLNIGTLINGSSNQTDNSIIEKYCYDNDESNCNVYGGLFQWNEMMQYSTTPGIQGICMAGWHLPTDAEWIVLTTYVSSQIEYICDSNTDWIAKALAATAYWSTSDGVCAIGNNIAANNATGFTGLPGASRDSDGTFITTIGNNGYFWSSTERETGQQPWSRGMNYSGRSLSRYNLIGKNFGFSVRCVKD